MWKGMWKGMWILTINIFGEAKHNKVAKLSIATGHAIQIYNCLDNCKFV